MNLTTKRQAMEEIGTQWSKQPAYARRMSEVNITVKTYEEAGDLAQLVNCLSCKHEDLHLDPQHPCKNRAQGHLSLIPNAGEARDGTFLPGEQYS